MPQRNQEMDSNGKIINNRGQSLQREIIEGRMGGKRGKGRPRQKLLDWMMRKIILTENFKFKNNFICIL